MTPQRRQAYILLHLVVLAFGLTGPLGKLITLESLPLVWYRMGLATLGLAAYLWFTRRVRPLGRGGRKAALAVGILVALHWVLFFASIKASTVAIALVCLATGAFMTALIEPAIYRRELRRSEMALGASAIAGIAIIYGFEHEGNSRGMLLGLASAFVGALFTAINGRLVQRYDSRALSIWELGGGWVALCPVMLLSNGIPGQPSGNDLFYLLILAWLCTSFAFVASIEVMRQISPFSVVLTVNLEPIYGIVLALILFGEEERMSGGFYMGAAIILAGIFLDGWIKRPDTDTRLIPS
jgi:drug/metabolite transporter (DMT)-like permease